MYKANNWQPPCTYHCEFCEVEFDNPKDFDNHLRRHETCGIDGCKFVAGPEELRSHILYLHSSGLYNRIQSGYSKEEILKWKADRQKNYPNCEKSNVAAEKRLKLRELKHQRYLARSQKRAQEEEAAAKRKPMQWRKRNIQPKESKLQEKRFQKFKFTFPEGDLDEDDDKNGSLVMFCGTKSYLHSLLPPETTDFVEEDKEDVRPDIDISDEDEWLVGKEEKVSTKHPLSTKIVSLSEENQISKRDSEMNMDTDDDSPLEVPISRQDTFEEKSKPVLPNKDSPKVPQTQLKVYSNQKCADQRPQRTKDVQRPKAERSSFRLVKKSFRNPTLLERLLEKDISLERSQILQCVKFICDKNFFGIGNNK